MYGFWTYANAFDRVVYGRIVSAPTKPYGLYTHLSLRGAKATWQSQKIGVSYEIATLTLAMTTEGGLVGTE